MKKRRVQQLSEKQAKQRLVGAKVFKKYISRRKLKFLYTMDEMMVSTTDLDGKTFHYYRREGVVVSDA